MTPQRALVRSATLNGYLGLAKSLHLDGARLMRRAGLDPADLAVRDKWVSAASAARLLHLSATASGCADFAVRLAERRRLSTIGPLSLVLREEPDLRSLLTLLLRYERSYNEALRMRLEESEDITTLQLWCEFGEPAPTGQALALSAAAVSGIIRACLGDRWRPLAVCFHDRAPASLEMYHRMFGPGLQFEHAFTGLVFYTRDLAAANKLADPDMRPYAHQFLEAVISQRDYTATERAKDLVEFLLPSGKCSMDRVARGLDLDPRTLHRRLAAEGESFSSILHSTRVGLAERYLANDGNTMTHVSELLGFTAPSAFSRWFHQQFGVSPSEWRAAARANRTPA